MFKYLFTALLSDNRVIEQNQEDKGLVEGKNCFYDVLQQEKDVRAFALYNQETGEEWIVDLHDGHFEHNYPAVDENTKEQIYTKSSFKLHGELVLTNLRLVWFIKRELVLDIVNTQVINNQIVSYNFGFQANSADGKNHQFVVSLS